MLRWQCCIRTGCWDAEGAGRPGCNGQTVNDQPFSRSQPPFKPNVIPASRVGSERTQRMFTTFASTDPATSSYNHTACWLVTYIVACCIRAVPRYANDILIGATYVCTYVCRYVCMQVSISISMSTSISMYICIYVSIYLHIYVCMHR